MSPFKRALRNSSLLAFMVIGIVFYQNDSIQDSLLTGLMTFGLTFPALWLSFNYTRKIAEKYREKDNELQEPTQMTNHESQVDDSSNSTHR